MNPQTVLTPQVEDLQRGYAAHTVALRGHLADGIKPTPPDDLTFSLAERDVRQGASVRVKEEFPSAPLFAYLDKIPLEIQTFRKPKSDQVHLKLVMPSKNVTGTVRLVWPDAVAIARHSIRVTGSATITRYTLSKCEVEPGEILRLPIQYAPMAVLVGTREIPFCYEQGELSVFMPEDAVSGLLTILTAGGVFQSTADLQIKSPEHSSRATPAAATAQ